MTWKVAPVEVALAISSTKSESAIDPLVSKLVSTWNAMRTRTPPLVTGVKPKPPTCTTPGESSLPETAIHDSVSVPGADTEENEMMLDG